MDDRGDDHKCNICNKIYSSYKTLWKHNKNKHKLNIQNNLNNSENNLIKSENNLIKLEKNINCRYCNKEYYNIKSRWSHEKKCQIIFNEKEQEKQINEIKIAEINSNKEIKLAEINEKIKIAEIELKLAEINSNKEIELKKLEIKKENTIIKQKSNRNPTIKTINNLLQNRINMNNSNMNSHNSNTNISPKFFINFF